jgi:hypothetical protein
MGRTKRPQVCDWIREVAGNAAVNEAPQLFREIQRPAF